MRFEPPQPGEKDQNSALFSIRGPMQESLTDHLELALALSRSEAEEAQQRTPPLPNTEDDAAIARAMQQLEMRAGLAEVRPLLIILAFCFTSVVQ